ncbi:MAG: DUF882 domain-containing protein [Hyphomicrobiaceae bacterium]
MVVWATLALGLALSAGSSAPTADTPGDRRLSLYNIHNGERLDIVYKHGEAYDGVALKKLNWIFRDWRRNQATQMDPKAFDLLWEIYQELGSSKPIHIVSGYRAPATNEKLRKAGGGQAKFSQHIQGKALDVHFPDVPVQRLRYSALVRERGGVGYYPTSALPFVHIDTGRVRMWPRMPRQELALLFPNGRSKFVPTDGRPITPADVSAARKNRKLYETVAAFHALRSRDRSTTLVAGLETASATTTVAVADIPAPQPVTLSKPDVASDAPVLDGPALTPPQPVLTAKKQVASIEAFLPPLPELAPTELTRRPAQLASRKELDDLVLASLGPESAVVTPPLKKPRVARASIPAGDAVIVPPAPEEMTIGTFLSRSGWARAPEFDEEHPSELSYRPFPLSVYLTADADLDQPALAKLHHPNFKAAHERLLDADAGLELSFKPRERVAALTWDGQFAPENILLSEMVGDSPSGKRVKTAKK